MSYALACRLMHVEQNCPVMDETALRTAQLVALRSEPEVLTAHEVALSTSLLSRLYDSTFKPDNSLARLQRPYLQSL